MIFWFLGFACLLFAAFFFIFFRAGWFFGRKPATVAEKCKYLGAVIGGVLLVVNALYIHQQTKEQRHSNDLVRKGQLDTRFKDAATLLANSNSSAELSAIHTLHQIAIEASKDEETKDYVQVIKHILISFIKDNSVIEKDTAYNKKSNLLLQTIVDYLFRVKQHEIFSEYETDLSKSVLKEIIFWEAQLDSASFFEAQLQGADFREAQLQGAFFFEAQLQGARFFEAQLQDAGFFRAQLQGAYFIEAKNIEKAHFRNTLWNLKTNFKGTSLEGKSVEELTEIMGNPPDPL